MNYFLSSRSCMRRLISSNRILRQNFHQTSFNSHICVASGHFQLVDQIVSLSGNFYARNYLRTAAWQAYSIPEFSSSPIRNQTRLFADIDRSNASDKSTKEGAAEKSVEAKKDEVLPEDDSKLTLAQRFKKMWKQYWYVLLPVHGVTYAAWFGLFYGISASGLDVIAFLEHLHLPDAVMTHIRNAPQQAGHFVVALALCKLFSPLRYMTTLGVTYYAVKTLSRLGYIKPMPNRKQIKAMIDDKREQFRRRRHRWRQERRFFVFKKRHGASTQQNGHHPPKRTPPDS